VNDFVRDALRFYPSLREEDVRVVLVHDGRTILPELGESLGSYAQRKLSSRRVEIRTGVRISGMSDDGVSLSDGAKIATRTLVWTAGTAPNPLIATLPCATEKGRLATDEFLAVPRWPGVWALGDCAAVPDAGSGKPCPPTAQHGLRQGRV